MRERENARKRTVLAANAMKKTPILPLAFFERRYREKARQPKEAIETCARSPLSINSPKPPGPSPCTIEHCLSTIAKNKALMTRNIIDRTLATDRFGPSTQADGAWTV